MEVTYAPWKKLVQRQRKRLRRWGRHQGSAGSDETNWPRETRSEPANLQIIIVKYHVVMVPKRFQRIWILLCVVTTIIGVCHGIRYSAFLLMAHRVVSWSDKKPTYHQFSQVQPPSSHLTPHSQSQIHSRVTFRCLRPTPKHPVLNLELVTATQPG